METDDDDDGGGDHDNDDPVFIHQPRLLSAPSSIMAPVTTTLNETFPLPWGFLVINAVARMYLRSSRAE